MRCVDNKRAFEFGFVWIFSIVAGAAILLLAIYGATQIGHTQRFETDASIAKKLTVITDPLEAGFASATFGTIRFSQETKIRNLCNSIGFGDNEISAATRSGVGKEWLDFSAGTTVREKYIFGLEEDVGETYYALSRAFSFPYKIADYVVLISANRYYCFVGAPKAVRDDLESLKIPAVGFVDSLVNCSSIVSSDVSLVRVCFETGGCEVSVESVCEGCSDPFGAGRVRYSNGREVSYAGDLLYAAIFSDESTYSCNVERLLYRGSVAAQVLSRKASLMNARGCATNLGPVVAGWGDALASASVDLLPSLYSDAVEMDRANGLEVCGLW